VARVAAFERMAIEGGLGLVGVLIEEIQKEAAILHALAPGGFNQTARPRLIFPSLLRT
jgi:hypothetical protein